MGVKAIGNVTLLNVDDGSQGIQGLSVSEVSTQYYLSTSPSELIGGSWEDTQPSVVTGRYLWERTKTKLSDNSYVYSDAIYSQTISGLVSNVDNINGQITNKVWQSDITSSISSYDGSTVSSIRDRVSQTETDITGITSRVSDVESTTNNLGTRMTSAESSITQNATNISLKVSKDSVISEINQSSEAVTISADKVNIEGATLFSSGRLSQTSLNNAYDSKGSAAIVQGNLDNLEIGGRNLLKDSKNIVLDWTLERATLSDGVVVCTPTSSSYARFYQMPANGYWGSWEQGDKYTVSVEARAVSGTSSFDFAPCGDGITPRLTHDVDTTWKRYNSTFISNNSTASMSFIVRANDGAVQFRYPKLEYGNKATSWTLAPEDVESSINTAQASANSAVASTVPCYYRSTTDSTPSISSSTTIGTSNNTDNVWSYVMPTPKRNCYFYICEEYTPVSGTKTYSTVRALDSQTYASKWVSSSDNTYIDGGRIYANSITASEIQSNTITANEIQSHSITANELATDAIKSSNYVASQNATPPYSVSGTFLDLTTGNIYTPNLVLNNSSGTLHVNGEIIADTGRIGGSSGWTIASQQISSGTLGSDNSMYLSTKNLSGTVANKTLPVTGSQEAWRLTVGSKFGVSSSGVLYANGANISGAITATSLNVGLSSDSNHLIYSNGAIDLSTDWLKFNSSTNTVTIGVTSSGNLRTMIDADTFQITDGTSDIAYIGKKNKLVTDVFVSNGTTTTFTLSYNPLSDGMTSPSSVVVRRSGRTITVDSGLPEDGHTFSYTYSPNTSITYYSMGIRKTEEDEIEFTMGNYSFASGMGTVASGEASHAEGYGTIASGHYSHAEGCESYEGDDPTIASGEASHAEGCATEAKGSYSHAEGVYSTARGTGSHSEGRSYAYGNYSHAEGNSTYAYGNSSHSGGFNTTAYSRSETVIGEFNEEEEKIKGSRGNYAFVIGNGYEQSVSPWTVRSNALTVDWDGNLDCTNHKDGIVAMGTSNSWYYRKWKSGFIECWRSISITPSAANTATSTSNITLPLSGMSTKYTMQATLQGIPEIATCHIGMTSVSNTAVKVNIYASNTTSRTVNLYVAGIAV